MASVLRVRKVQEDIAAAARQRAELDVAAEETRFAAREADVRHAWRDRALVDLAFAAVDRASATLAGANAVADDRRTEHIAAVQRARAIERLVERRRAEAAAEAARKSAAVLDDLATTRHIRRTAS
jgi:flagellar biosynthesis chaperone FliJ